MDDRSPILGRPIVKDEHYIIVGGGISGLLLGFFMKESGVSFEIHEKSNRLGGLIDTIEGPYGWAETGANGILWCKEIDYVVERLGVEPLQPNQKDKKRFFVRNKKLRQFPLNVLEAMTMAARLMVPHRGAFSTVADFGNAYLGKAGTRQILSPALSGIYGTPADQLSFEGSAKMLSAILHHSRWLPLGILRHRKASSKTGQLQRKGLHSFNGGMRALVDALAQYLQGHIQVNSTVDQLNDKASYVLTTPASTSARLIKSDELVSLLKSIDYQPLISANLYYKKKQLRAFKPGFGCLIPRNEGLKSLGVLFSSVIYPKRAKAADVVSLRCILHQDNDTRAMDDEALIRMLHGELNQLFDIDQMPVDRLVHRWEAGLPIYNNQLMATIGQLDHTLNTVSSNIRLFGNYTGEISVRGACQTGYRMMEDLQK